MLLVLRSGPLTTFPVRFRVLGTRRRLAGGMRNEIDLRRTSRLLSAHLVTHITIRMYTNLPALRSLRTHLVRFLQPKKLNFPVIFGESDQANLRRSHPKYGLSHGQQLSLLQ